MEYNKESFNKALKECGIIRWENHFEKVVKAYLKAETEQLTIPDVMQRSELLLFADYYENDKTSQTTDEVVDNYLAEKSNSA